MFAGRDICTTNTRLNLPTAYPSLDTLSGPRGECKQICVGCQLPSLLKDKDSIRGMLLPDQDVPKLTGHQPGSAHDQPFSAFFLSLNWAVYLSPWLIRTGIVPENTPNQSCLPTPDLPSAPTSEQPGGLQAFYCVRLSAPSDEPLCPPHRITSLYV